MKIQLRVCIIALTVLFSSFLLFNNDLHAKPLPQATKPYEYTSHDQALEDIVRYFGRNIGMAAKISGKLDTPVFLPKNARWTRQSFLNYLSERYHLVWYLDETSVYFSLSDDQVTELYSFKQPNSGNVLKMLSDIGLLEGKFVHRYDRNNKILVVEGPQSYVDKIKKALTAFEKADRLTTTILRGQAEPDGHAQVLPLQTPEDKGFLPSL